MHQRKDKTMWKAITGPRFLLHSNRITLFIKILASRFSRITLQCFSQTFLLLPVKYIVYIHIFKLLCIPVFYFLIITNYYYFF